MSQETAKELSLRVIKVVKNKLKYLEKTKANAEVIILSINNIMRDFKKQLDNIEDGTSNADERYAKLQKDNVILKKALTEISNGTAEVSVDDFNASLKLSVDAIYAEQALAEIEKGVN